MNILKMLKSFTFAVNGLIELAKSENNAKFHLLATIIVIIAGFLLEISQTEWITVIFAIGLVWSAEALNTAIEKLCDFVSPQHNELIGKTKDLASGGVLVVAIAAAIAGMIIFLPKILNLLN